MLRLIMSRRSRRRHRRAGARDQARRTSASQVDDVKAAKLAFAVRQRQGLAGAAAERRRKAAPPGIVTVETLLLGVPPVQRRCVAGRPADELRRDCKSTSAYEDGIAPARSRRRCRPAPRSAACRCARRASGRPRAPGGADLVVVGCSRRTTRQCGRSRERSRERPGRPVVVLYAGTPNGFMERAFEAGADDLIIAAAGAGPARASRSRRRSRGAAARSRRVRRRHR